MSSIMGNTKVQIIPEPAVVELQGNETYCLKRDTIISFSDKSLQFTANYLADYLDRYLGIPMQVVAQKKNDASQGDACIKLVNRKRKKEIGGRKGRQFTFQRRVGSPWKQECLFVLRCY